MPEKQPPNGSVDTGRLLETLQAVARGDFSVRMPADQAGTTGKIYDTVNEVIELNDFTVKEVQRVHKEVGLEGKITQRASPGSTRGAWRTYVDSFNGIVDDLVQPMTEVGQVIDAVANGDLSQKITVDVRGEMLGLKNTINSMVDQFSSFSS
ncbi:MAG: HAMP domain-containing protein, partial [candidate division Zixibacteria bacterium]|nr:HAMP domain-containing protein [candidate division Zixibacteria bacterium]